MISEPQSLSTVLSACEKSGIAASKVLVFDPIKDAVPEGFESWKVLLQHGERDWIRFDDEKVSKSTTAARLFSSGTTGLPKAAAISHYNLVAQHTLAHETNKVPYQVCTPVQFSHK